MFNILLVFRRLFFLFFWLF